MSRGIYQKKKRRFFAIAQNDNKEVQNDNPFCHSDWGKSPRGISLKKRRILHYAIASFRMTIKEDQNDGKRSAE